MKYPHAVITLEAQMRKDLELLWIKPCTDLWWVPSLWRVGSLWVTLLWISTLRVSTLGVSALRIACKTALVAVRGLVEYTTRPTVAELCLDPL